MIKIKTSLPLNFFNNGLTSHMFKSLKMRTVCGLDVRKDSVFMCILDSKGEKIMQRPDILSAIHRGLRMLHRHRKIPVGNCGRSMRIERLYAND